MQNLAQSAISAATFGAGNALMLPIGIPFVLGRPDLVPALFAGVFLAMLIDGYLLYRMFDSEVFPATGAWPRVPLRPRRSAPATKAAGRRRCSASASLSASPATG